MAVGYKETVFSDDGIRSIEFNVRCVNHTSIKFIKSDIKIGEFTIEEDISELTNKVLITRYYFYFLRKYLELGFDNLCLEEVENLVHIGLRARNKRIEDIRFWIYDGDSTILIYFKYIMLNVYLYNHGLQFQMFVNATQRMDRKIKIFEMTADSLIENGLVYLSSYSLKGDAQTVIYKHVTYKMLRECKERLCDMERLKAVKFFETGNLINLSPEDEKRYNTLCAKTLIASKDSSMLPEIYVRDNGDCIVLWFD